MAVLVRSSPLSHFPINQSQSPLPLLASTMSACPQENHVLTFDASKPERCLELVQSPLFHTMSTTTKKNVIQSLIRSLMPDNCIQIRSAAKNNSLNDLTDRCDRFIGATLVEMLAQEDFLSLPRVQVNVKASNGMFELSSDSNIIEELVPKVVQVLETNCAAHLEETALEMHLMDDYSVTLPNSKAKLSNILSPEKPEGSFQHIKMMNPSPARKLILGSSSESVDDEEEDLNKEPKPGKLVIISSQKMSELSAICVVKSSQELVLVNVSLVPPNATDKELPVSPTTGLPFLNGTTLLAQMGIARSGFGVTSLDGALMSIGGFNREGCITSTERYDYTQNTWENVGDLNTKRARFGTVKLDETVYAFGGSDGQHELASMEAYNFEERKWSRLETCMTTPRSCFGATTLNNRIYAVGGLYYSTPLKSAEVFNPSTYRWEPLPSMHTWRRDVAVTSCVGKVYAIGGQTSGWSCLASVECYNPLTRKWAKVPSMKTPRRNAAAVTVDDKIYVIGGYNGSTAVRHVEVFDPLTNAWTQSSQTNVKRSYPAATVIDQSIYVVGGFSTSSFLNSMERFDLASNQWTSFV